MRVDQVKAYGPGGPKIEPGLSKPGTAKNSFSAEFKGFFKEVNSLQLEADQAMSNAATQGTGKIHETMIQLEEAAIATRLLLKVRTKALEAYQEVMRMQF